jgi:hypothetical protein
MATRGPAAETRSSGQEEHLLDPIGTAAWPKPEQTAKISGLLEPVVRWTAPHVCGAANAGRNMCDLCSRMTRLSCQRDIHAIISWLEQMDLVEVQAKGDYTANGEFAKSMRGGATQDLLDMGRGKRHVYAVT